MDTVSEARVALITTWLKDRGVVLFGRAYDIIDPDGLAECARDLAAMYAEWDRAFDDLVNMRTENPPDRFSDHA